MSDTTSASAARSRRQRTLAGCVVAAVLIAALGAAGLYRILFAPGAQDRLAEWLECTEVAARPTVDLSPLFLAHLPGDDTAVRIAAITEALSRYDNAHILESGDPDTLLRGHFVYEDYAGEAGWLREFGHSLLWRNQSIVSFEIESFSDDRAAAKALGPWCLGRFRGFDHPELIVSGSREDSAYCHSYVQKSSANDGDLDACSPLHQYDWFAAVRNGNTVIVVEENTWTVRRLLLQEGVDRLGAALGQ